MAFIFSPLSPVYCIILYQYTFINLPSFGFIVIYIFVVDGQCERSYQFLSQSVSSVVAKICTSHWWGREGHPVLLEKPYLTDLYAWALRRWRLSVGGKCRSCMAEYVERLPVETEYKAHKLLRVCERNGLYSQCKYFVILCNTVIFSGYLFFLTWLVSKSSVTKSFCFESASNSSVSLL